MNQVLNPFDLLPRREWQKRCYDLFFLCSVVLATAFRDKFNNPGVMHKKVCKFLQYDPSPEKLISCFRGSFKTTYLLGFIVWHFIWSLILKKPVSICYNTATKENAENFMTDFHTIMLECKFLHKIFPFLPSTKPQYRRFTLYRVEFKWFKFHVSSLEVKQVSRHYTFIINDDLVNDDNAYSVTEREKVKRRWKFQQSILTMYKKFKVGLIIEVGTPYHNNDLMSYLMTKVGFYTKFIQPYKHKNGHLALPEVYCQEDFDKIRKKQGKSIFATQYELRVLYDQDKLVTEDQITYIDFMATNYIRKVIVDPGGSDELAKNTPTGVIIVDYTSAGTIDQIYEFRDWITPTQFIRLLMQIKRDYDPDEIRIEREKFTTTIADTVDHLALDLNIAFVNPQNMPKPKRAQRLKQWFETRRWRFSRSCPQSIEDACEHPDEQYKELIDCMAYAVDPQVLEFPKNKYGRPEDDEVPDRGFTEELERIMKLNTPDTEMADAIF